LFLFCISRSPHGYHPDCSLTPHPDNGKKLPLQNADAEITLFSAARRGHCQQRTAIEEVGSDEKIDAAFQQNRFALSFVPTEVQISLYPQL
jgi:hypothetical protein